MGFVEEILNNYTNTSTFLLRGLGTNTEDLKKLGFINAYIDDANHEPHYEEAIYLLFKPEDIEEFQFFIMKEQEREAEIIEDYDYEGGYIVMVYKFPEKYNKEYNLFLRGEYSGFRKSYVDLFPIEVQIKNKFGAIIATKASAYYHIFNRTPELRKYWEDKLDIELDDEAEYWEGIDIKKETLDIKKIKNEQ